MRDPIPRGPFDQGLFLAHFNKGRDLYDAQRYEDAEQQLEEAYLLRPRDQKVLNLLGLVYFRQEKFEKAEEVYRKLVAESPEAHTLHYNLGLIHFKLNRLEDAESSFLKALELTKDNPKINFYLGSIYERLHRFKDAIYQYREAGANIMVRRVEDKMAATGAARSGHPRRPRRKKDDTAEFPATRLRRSASRSGARPRTTARSEPDQGAVQPVSPALLAEGAPTSARRTVPRRSDSTLPPQSSCRGARPPSRVARALCRPHPARLGRAPPRALPLPREQPPRDRLLGQGLHQAGDDLLLQRQPHLLGQGEAARGPGRRS